MCEAGRFHGEELYFQLFVPIPPPFHSRQFQHGIVEVKLPDHMAPFYAKVMFPAVKYNSKLPKKIVFNFVLQQVLYNFWKV